MQESYQSRRAVGLFKSISESNRFDSVCEALKRPVKKRPMEGNYSDPKVSERLRINYQCLISLKPPRMILGEANVEGKSSEKKIRFSINERLRRIKKNVDYFKIAPAGEVVY